MAIKRIKQAALTLVLLGVLGAGGAALANRFQVGDEPAAREPDELPLARVAQAKPGGPGAARKLPREILEKRAEAARKVYQQNLAHIRGGKGLPSELFGWSERWLEAQLPLCDKESERVQALRDYLARAREIERYTAALAQAARGRQTDADAATYYRLEAEIRLLREGVEPQPAKAAPPR